MTATRSTWNTALGVFLAAAALLILVTITVATSGPPDTEPTPIDPYDTYLANAPLGEPTLSREDAQLRALAGCGQQWAPGTVDAVLADAYKGICP